MKPDASWVLAAIGGLAPLSAFAQTTSADSDELAEIVVTAEKRSENIQVVPIAITAFSESELRVKGLTNIHSLSSLIPNVNLDEGSPFSVRRSAGNV